MTAIKNKVTSRFADLAQYDATTGNVTGFTVGNIVTTVGANLGNVSNVHITGGTANFVLATDGTGNLAWQQPSAVLANNMTFTTSTYAPDATYVAGWFAGNPIVLNGTGNLQAQLPANTQVRFRTGGPAYIVARVNQLTLNSKYSIQLTTNTTEDIDPTTPLQVTVTGVASRLVQGNNITFIPDANVGSLIISTQPTNIQVTGGGNFIVAMSNSTTTTANAFVIQNQSNVAANAIFVTSQSNRSYQARRTQINVNGGLDYVVPWDIVDVNTIPNFTVSNGVFTNTSNAIRKFRFDYQSAISAQSTGFTQCDMWFQQNAPSTIDGTKRRGQTAYNSTSTTSTEQMLSTSWTFIMAPNDTVTCWAWASQNYTLGAAKFGLTANYSTVINVTEVM